MLHLTTTTSLLEMADIFLLDFLDTLQGKRDFALLGQLAGIN